VLRTAADELLSTDEIAGRVIAAKGFDAKDAILRAAIREQIGSTVTRLHRHGAIENVGARRASKWKLSFSWLREASRVRARLAAKITPAPVRLCCERRRLRFCAHRPARAPRCDAGALRRNYHSWSTTAGAPPLPVTPGSHATASQSKLLRSEACIFGNPGAHFGADFFPIAKREGRGSALFACPYNPRQPAVSRGCPASSKRKKNDAHPTF
jgi:hypothetical protein